MTYTTNGTVCWQGANMPIYGHTSITAVSRVSTLTWDWPSASFLQELHTFVTIRTQFKLRAGSCEDFLQRGNISPRPTANIFNTFQVALHPQPGGTICRTDRDQMNMLTVKQFVLSSSLLPKTCQVQVGWTWKEESVAYLEVQSLPFLTTVGVPAEIWNQRASRTKVRTLQLAR
jgi:hypothetical protein